MESILREVKIAELDNEKLGDEVVIAFSNQGALFDCYMTNAMRDWMTPEDGSRGFGMADSYMVSLVQNEAIIDKTPLIIFSDNDPEQTYELSVNSNGADVKTTLRATSFAANLVIANQLGWALHSKMEMLNDKFESEKDSLSVDEIVSHTYAAKRLDDIARGVFAKYELMKLFMFTPAFIEMFSQEELYAVLAIID